MKHDQRQARGPASRLLLLGLVLILALTPLLTPGPGSTSTPPAAIAASKNKNKHAKQAAAAQDAACQIKKSRSTWKLQANCTITTTIEIPRGVTFNGNGKTITMTGPVSNYLRSLPDGWSVNAGILANGGTANVKDLKLKGSGLTGTCPSFFPPAPGVTPEGISFINTSGTIDEVVVTDVRLDGARTCGVGISAAGTGNQRVIVKDASVSGSTTQGIWGLSRPGTAGLRFDVDTANVTMIAVPGGFEAGQGTAIAFGLGPVSGSVNEAAITLQDEDTNGMSLGITGAQTPRRVDLKEVAITGIGNNGIFGSLGSSNLAPIVTMSEVDISLTGDPSLFSGQGMFFNGPFDVRISDSTVRGASYVALWFEGTTTKATIEDSVIEASFVGIEAAFFSTVSVVDSTIRDVFWGVSVDQGSTFTAQDTTIRGRGPSPDQAFGIAYFAPDTQGSVADVAISGFSDTNPDTVSCGLLIQAGAGSVEVDDVSFPSPGNEQNLCDEQNAPANQALAAADSPVAELPLDADDPSATDAPVPPMATGANTAGSAETTATTSPTSGNDVTAQPASESAKEKDGTKGKDKHKGKAKSHDKKGNGNGNGKSRTRRGGN